MSKPIHESAAFFSCSSWLGRRQKATAGRRDYRPGLTGGTRMSKRSIESRAQELLTRARKLAQTSGLTWVEANNAIYGPGGPFARRFPGDKARGGFARAKKSR